jgi:cytochrome c biogenesis protein CcmG/thiol:disulfide interchange protein DsbE
MDEVTPLEERRAGRPRRWIRWVWLPVVALGFVLLLATGLLKAPGHPGAGKPAPGFSAPLLGGNGTLSLSDLEGKPVVLNFWASWCGPCKDEAPLLRRAHERFGDRVAFVGVDSHDARSDALAFLHRYRIDYPNVFDGDQQIYRDYGLTGQPETFFIDRSGEIAAHVPGPLYGRLLHRDLEKILNG